MNSDVWVPSQIQEIRISGGGTPATVSRRYSGDSSRKPDIDSSPKISSTGSTQMKNWTVCTLHPHPVLSLPFLNFSPATLPASVFTEPGLTGGSSCVSTPTRETSLPGVHLGAGSFISLLVSNCFQPLPALSYHFLPIFNLQSYR